MTRLSYYAIVRIRTHSSFLGSCLVENLAHFAPCGHEVVRCEGLEAVSIYNVIAFPSVCVILPEADRLFYSVNSKGRVRWRRKHLNTPYTC